MGHVARTSLRDREIDNADPDRVSEPGFTV